MMTDWHTRAVEAGVTGADDYYAKRKAEDDERRTLRTKQHHSEKRKQKTAEDNPARVKPENRLS